MKRPHDTVIATPEQRRALHRNLQQLLRDQAEFLVRAVEELPTPTTHAEAEKAAKSIQAVMVVVGKLFATMQDDDQLNWRNMPTLDEERQHLAEWQIVLDQRFDHFVVTRQAKLDAV